MGFSDPPLVDVHENPACDTRMEGMNMKRINETMLYNFKRRCDRRYRNEEETNGKTRIPGETI